MKSGQRGSSDLADDIRLIKIFRLVDYCFIFHLVILWTAAVRRLHDHNLSGNWLFFLSPIGIGLMYMAHVLDLDVSIEPVVRKINKTGIFNWLYAGVAWFFTSGIVLFCLLYLCVGKREDNMFGPNPYPPVE